MERSGIKLKQVREKLGLTYRDVAHASQQIAERYKNDEYVIALSRLADIENKGTVPSIYRLYSLCAIYRLDFHEALQWYGVALEMLYADALRIPHAATHPMQFHSPAPVPLPEQTTMEIDSSETTFLGQFLRKLGRGGLAFLAGGDSRNHRCALIGLEDWSMHPVLHPGSLVLIDESRRRIAASGWTSELDRPIYFIQHRDGYHCGWCAMRGEMLIVQFHPSSQVPPVLMSAGEFDVLGQVAGVAMLFASKKPRPLRTAALSAVSPDL